MIEKHALTITAALLLAGATQAAAQATDSVVVVAPEGSTILRLNRNGGFVVFGELGAGSSDGIPAAGPGTRLLWHAWKAAFRAGIVEATQWDEANVGSYSTAFGKNAEASGTGSFAAGEDVAATGENATAMGLRASAVGIATFAAGQDVVAYGNYSVALGVAPIRTRSTGPSSSPTPPPPTPSAPPSTMRPTGGSREGSGSTPPPTSAPASPSNPGRA